MAALPYMQLYVAEYLADTTHLSAAQHGAYMLLLMNYWQRGKALKNSNERLANVARMSNEEWNANREVLEEFFEVTDEEWFHHRVERDLELVRVKSGKASAAGKASAEARANKRSTDVEQTLTPSTNETPTRIQPLRTDTDTDTEQKQRTTPSPSAKAEHEEFLASWNQNRGQLPEAKALTPSRKKKLAVRVREGLTAEIFASAVKLAARTPFCRGDNTRGWRLDFDFLVENDTNLTKVLEGKYGLPDPGPMVVREMSITEALGDFLPVEFREPKAGAA